MKFHVAGVPVQFPFSPYRAQLGLMHGLVTAVKTGEQAVIESPTGSGKTMAVLCASLAAANHVQYVEKGIRPSTSSPPEPYESSHVKQELNVATGSVLHNDSDSDFEEPIMFRDTRWQIDCIDDRETHNREFTSPHQWFTSPPPLPERCLTRHGMEEPSRARYQIIFATRTHSQIGQMLQELRRTAYKPSVAVLASRRQYCVHPRVREAHDINTSCRRLRGSNGSCKYLFNVESFVRQHSSHEVLDIEDLVSLGNENRACPYYVSHAMAKNADLVFCPYNYILDPVCRLSMQVDIENSIIIFDESHNIESIGRELASFQCNISTFAFWAQHMSYLSEPSLGDGLQSCLKRLSEPFFAIVGLSELVLGGDSFVDTTTGDEVVCNGSNVAKYMQAAGITDSILKNWKQASDVLMKREKAERLWRRYHLLYGEQKSRTLSLRCTHKRDDQTPERAKENVAPLSNTSSHFCCDINGENSALGRNTRTAATRFSYEQTMNITYQAKALISSLQLMHRNPGSFALVVTRCHQQFGTSVALKFLCMNAAVCTTDIFNSARSVIFISGTLTPMPFFAAEIGCGSTIMKCMTHNQTIDNQLFAAIAAQGPSNVPMLCTSKFSSNSGFQDSLGQSLIDYSSAIPGGVLVFFPSYRVLHTLVSRWQSTGLWHYLLERNGFVGIEGKQNDDEFDSTVSQYRQMASTQEGSLLLCICRGKLSEGMDFRDEACRGVIIVGIPFPNIGDVRVTCKRTWNDQRRNENPAETLLSGQEWYEREAFIAVNQALGRVIRHRNDYGAVILMDLRFGMPQLQKYLQRSYLRKLSKHQHAHDEVMNNVRHFFRIKVAV